MYTRTSARKRLRRISRSWQVPGAHLAALELSATNALSGRDQQLLNDESTGELPGKITQSKLSTRSVTRLDANTRNREKEGVRVKIANIYARRMRLARLFRITFMRGLIASPRRSRIRIRARCPTRIIARCWRNHGPLSTRALVRRPRRPVLGRSGTSDSSPSAPRFRTVRCA